MKQIATLLLFAAFLISCGSSQINNDQTDSNPRYTIYENIDVLAVHQTMPKGIFIKRLRGVGEMYKVSRPLEDGKKYRVTIRVANSRSNVKEAEIIAFTQL